MLDIVIVLFVTTLIAGWLISAHAHQLRHPKTVLWGLYAYHMFFCMVYYVWTFTNNSDSKAYYRDSSYYTGEESWWSFYDFGTPFIEFLAHPFVGMLGMSYAAVMFLFGFFGFVGFYFIYLLIVERTAFRHRLFGIDAILLILFLPIAHFYSGSLGKGSVILMGMGLFFYGFNRIGSRLLYLVIGGVIVMHVRAHIMMAICVAAVLASLFSSRGIRTWQKVVIMLIAIVAIAPLFETVTGYVGIDSDADAISEWSAKRTQDLKKANSAVDIDNYSQPMKLFTFLFRPLFIDSPNALGIIVSFENLILLFLFIKTFSIRFVKYIVGSPWMIKMALVTFFAVSVALAQISSNMGIAIRQKSQVLFLFFLVLLSYADWAYRTERKVVIGE